MCNQTRERRIAELCHGFVDEVIAPLLTAMTDPQRQVDVISAALTKKQTAVALGNVSTRTINRLIADGKLLATGVGSNVRIAKSEVDRYLHANPPKPK